jgi:hypothetical protein
MNPNFLGCYAEHLFAAECSRRGYIISMPVLHSSTYDCILDIDGRLLKIQVKSTNKTPLINRKSISLPLHNNDGKYTKKKIDWFCAYSVYFGGFFNFPNKGDMKSIRLSITGKNSIYFNNFVFL